MRKRLLKCSSSLNAFLSFRSEYTVTVAEARDNQLRFPYPTFPGACLFSCNERILFLTIGR